MGTSWEVLVWGGVGLEGVGGEGVGGRDGGMVQGVASAWADMMSSMLASPPGMECYSSLLRKGRGQGTYKELRSSTCEG